MNRSYLMVWIVVMIAIAAAFVVHLATRFETVRLGYEVSAAKEEQKELIEKKRLLATEAATLTQVSRIEMIATQTLKMAQPKTNRIIYLGKNKKESNNSISGRAR